MSRRPPLALIYAVTLTGILNNTLVTPALPDILEDLNVGSERSGMLVASGSVAGIVMAPIVGLLADRYGRRLVLTVCLAVFGTAGGLAALAPTFPILLVARFFQGFGSAGLINLAVVLIGDHWSGAERTRLVGRNSAILTVGLASLPLLSGSVTEAAGWRVTFGIYTVGLVTAGVAWMVLDAKRPATRPRVIEQLTEAGKMVRRPVVATTIGASFFVFAAIFGLMLTVMPVHLGDEFGLGAAARGAVISVPAITSTIAAFNLSRIRAVLSPRAVVMVGAGMFLAVFLTYGLSPILIPVLLAALVFGAAEGALLPTLQDLNVDGAPDEHRGAVVAAWVGAARLGQTVGPLLAGLGIGLFGTRTTLVVGSVVAVLIGLIGLLGPLPRVTQPA